MDKLQFEKRLFTLHTNHNNTEAHAKMFQTQSPGHS